MISGLEKEVQGQCLCGGIGAVPGKRRKPARPLSRSRLYAGTVGMCEQVSVGEGVVQAASRSSPGRAPNDSGRRDTCSEFPVAIRAAPCGSPRIPFFLEQRIDGRLWTHVLVPAEMPAVELSVMQKILSVWSKTNV